MVSEWHPSLELLSLYAEQAELGDEAAAVERHIECCPDCFAAVALHRALLDAEHLEPVTLPEVREPFAEIEPSATVQGPEEEYPAPEEPRDSAWDWLVGLAGGLGLAGTGHMTPAPALGNEHSAPHSAAGQDDQHASGAHFEDTFAAYHDTYDASATDSDTNHGPGGDEGHGHHG